MEFEMQHMTDYNKCYMTDLPKQDTTQSILWKYNI